MKTQILDENRLDIAADIIRNGGLVVFPTETVYGLGANAFKADAAGKIYKAKGRPSDNPLIVHIADISQLSLCMEGRNDLAMQLLKEFAPGPITVIVRKNKNISENVTASLDTVGVRIPSHPIARLFLRACDVPVAAPSANISGKPSPTNFEMACANMMNKADAIIKSDSSRHGLESTIVDCTSSDTVSILRPGSITLEMITSVLPEHIIIKKKESSGKVIMAPGMKYTHYKPQADICLFHSDEAPLLQQKLTSFPNPHKALVIGVSQIQLPDSGVRMRRYNSLDEYASSLFSTFHEADENDIKIIFAEYPENRNLGHALRNRLKKAAAGNFLN